MDNENIEKSLIKLINTELYDLGVEIEDYQKINFSLYNEEVLQNILRKCKFKDIGNVYDYPDHLPQPESIDGFALSGNYELFQRICVSKKFNSIVFYTNTKYRIECQFLIDIDHLEEFSKITKIMFQQDSSVNLFRGKNFKCKDKEYIEIIETDDDDTKDVDLIKKRVIKEKLIFSKDSVLTEIMNDINTFFNDKTRNLYSRLQIAYKRGIIIYGEPGNGKSALIREIIRTDLNISKIMLNSSIRDITRILAALIKALDGKLAIIIIEDIDSVITSRNRSEFLNILDGVNVTSGVYFIGTTNYPDQIDPAFMNRSGRFDRTYEVGNPSEDVRRAFYKDRNIADLLSEFKVYKDDSKPDTDDAIIELFVKYSHDLPMASLKEVMTSTQYVLANNPDMSIEEATEKTYSILIGNKKGHAEAHNKFKAKSEFKLPTGKGPYFNENNFNGGI